LKDKTASPLTYEWDFSGGVFGVTIDAKTGLVKWTAHTVWYGQLSYQIKATNANGVSDIQTVTHTVCVPTKKWDIKMRMCR
jgi:Putative Ig domain